MKFCLWGSARTCDGGVSTIASKGVTVNEFDDETVDDDDGIGDDGISVSGGNIHKDEVDDKKGEEDNDIEDEDATDNGQSNEFDDITQQLI